MVPGDVVVLNPNIEHRGTCPNGGYAVFLVKDCQDFIPALCHVPGLIMDMVELELRLAEG
jgi:hypothetical protein